MNQLRATLSNLIKWYNNSLDCRFFTDNVARVERCKTAVYTRRLDMFNARFAVIRPTQCLIKTLKFTPIISGLQQRQQLTYLKSEAARDVLRMEQSWKLVLWRRIC